ncbi:Uncharacterised protein [Streptococcus equi subsp. equi]|nr:Uncharacterised protein [Streptococcus equi subsp. equi]CRR32915.1 Uncharacterised protein [Streptococcus equi subsp. equi]CRR46995.1 Uncharacterised protein [Streptococcus equi subsp. equi]CRT06038.1 Uncharacterised protein [Streptococcus equi subsp. equi]CRU57499.1 Uncharacterised protein [Streptococcus equi subsp. equi]
MGTQVLIISKNNGLNIGVNIAYITAICPGIGNDDMTSILFAIFYWYNSHSLHTIVGGIFGFEDFDITIKNIRIFSNRNSYFISINIIYFFREFIIIFITNHYYFSL